MFVKEHAPPCLTQGVRLYAVGDIHGRRDLLELLLARIQTDAAAVKKRNIIVFLGDYVDRGPDSKDVIARFLTLDLPGWEIVFLRGNHDQAVLDFLNDANFYRAWRSFGAAETLLSYGVTPPRFDKEEAFAEVRAEFAGKLPPPHLKFFDGLKYSYVAGDYMFVHAGVRPGIALDRQLPEDLMWIREEFLMSDQRLKKMIVHGHTPADRPVQRPNRIGVDTGAYATGRLTAVVLDGHTRAFLSVDDTQCG